MELSSFCICNSYSPLASFAKQLQLTRVIRQTVTVHSRNSPFLSIVSFSQKLYNKIRSFGLGTRTQGSRGEGNWKQLHKLFIMGGTNDEKHRSHFKTEIHKWNQHR